MTSFLCKKYTSPILAYPNNHLYPSWYLASATLFLHREEQCFSVSRILYPFKPHTTILFFCFASSFRCTFRIFPVLFSCFSQYMLLNLISQTPLIDPTLHCLNFHSLFSGIKLNIFTSSLFSNAINFIFIKRVKLCFLIKLNFVWMELVLSWEIHFKLLVFLLFLKERPISLFTVLCPFSMVL